MGPKLSLDFASPQLHQLSRETQKNTTEYGSVSRSRSVSASVHLGCRGMLFENSAVRVSLTDTSSTSLQATDFHLLRPTSPCHFNTYMIGWILGGFLYKVFEKVAAVSTRPLVNC